MTLCIDYQFFFAWHIFFCFLSIAPLALSLKRDDLNIVTITGIGINHTTVILVSPTSYNIEPSGYASAINYHYPNKKRSKVRYVVHPILSHYKIRTLSLYPHTYIPMCLSFLFFFVVLLLHHIILYRFSYIYCIYYVYICMYIRSSI